MALSEVEPDLGNPAAKGQAQGTGGLQEGQRVGGKDVGEEDKAPGRGHGGHDGDLFGFEPPVPLHEHQDEDENEPGHR